MLDLFKGQGGQGNAAEPDQDGPFAGRQAEGRGQFLSRWEGGVADRSDIEVGGEGVEGRSRGNAQSEGSLA